MRRAVMFAGLNLAGVSKEMMKIAHASLVFFLLVHSSILRAQETTGDTITISARVGEAIDSSERARFNLFPAVKGFRSAVFVRLPDSTFALRITSFDSAGMAAEVSDIPQPEWRLRQWAEQIDHYEEIEEGKYRLAPVTVPANASGLVILPRVGSQIDRQEREYFQLFPGINNFRSAIVAQKTRTAYEYIITTDSDSGIVSGRLTVTEYFLLSNYLEHAEAYAAGKSSDWDSISGVINLERVRKQGKRNLGKGSSVKITLETGQVVTGLLIHADSERLIILPGREKFDIRRDPEKIVRLTWHNVRDVQVRRSRSPALGIVLGSLLGMTLGAAVGSSSAPEDDGGFGPDFSALEHVATAVIAFGVVGAMVGGVIGASPGYEMLGSGSHAMEHAWTLLKEQSVFRNVLPPELLH